MESANCTCPPLSPERIDELAIYMKQMFDLPESEEEIAYLFGKPKPVDPIYGEQVGMFEE